jgi:NAD(P)-dependent dehydrogenase (short-subunit alcohol dehydrogenase family)
MVTGGTRGIGWAITRQLIERGWQVSVLATKPTAPPELADFADAVAYVAGSVAEPADHRRFLDATVGAFGRVDLLVNNAGVAPRVRTDILQADPEEFDRVMGINLRGPYFLTQLVARQLIAQGGPGTIINISSISATTVSVDRGEYCLSKAGVAMATQLWAARLAPEGIVVYEVRPGVVDTDMTAAVRQKYDALFAAGLAPMARWGQPDDVASVVVALSAGMMPYSTGDVIHVAGGQQIPRL